jgi:hypothetical protein
MTSLLSLARPAMLNARRLEMQQWFPQFRTPS